MSGAKQMKAKESKLTNVKRLTDEIYGIEIFPTFPKKWLVVCEINE